VGTCSVCHNAFDLGGHSTALPINIGVTLAAPVDNDGRPIAGILDVANLPVYTLRRTTDGTTLEVTDPARALISGHFRDLGKTKGPILRGLAGRAPYFHNGSAGDLQTVVEFYDARFEIGLSVGEKRDLVAFLSAL
jgi:cytochrome c peroxidase